MEPGGRMRRSLSLLLPALLPSWRFFRHVGPSPRLAFRRSATEDWQPVCPRPARVPPLRMLCRLVWNPRWNEGLYLVSLSERLAETGSTRARDEILRRVARLTGTPPDALHLRLSLRSREDAGIVEEVLFETGPPT